MQIKKDENGIKLGLYENGNSILSYLSSPCF